MTLKIRKIHISITIILLILFFPIILPAQSSFDWWNDKHNWDGVSHWREYLIYSPEYFGPNALPVPRLKSGIITDFLTLDFSAGGHFNTGDQTFDTDARLFLPLGQKAGLELQMVPLEFYRMDSLNRDRRRARDFDGQGWASGDLYLSTYVQVIKNHRKLPDVLLTVNLRTAAGNRLTAARYTDAPGYFFDLSFGKDISVGGSFIRSIRPHGMLGFYVWQTNLDDVLQNDAALFGLGTTLTGQQWQLTHALAGYAGYLNNGDKPLVYRIEWRGQAQKAFNFLLSAQVGLNDYPFTSFRLGTTVDLQKLGTKADRE